ncbi:hypothetical protein [Streptomyces parvulus]|uniref:hypothetical protein n=1 Tax=Streptomyces parvulus TaxID=146923 RepID=UPI0011C05B54|nr:hypothetical protein [Streptomyces parvulus]
MNERPAGREPGRGRRVLGLGLRLAVAGGAAHGGALAVDAAGNESPSTPVLFAVAHVTAGATAYGY